MEQIFLHVKKYLGRLPRRLSTAINGNRRTMENFYSNDIYFALAKKDDTFGFNLFLGGKNSEMAQSVDIFVPPSEVAPLFQAILESFMEHGLRANRVRTRLFHLIEEVGISKVREYIQTYYKKGLTGAGENLDDTTTFKPTLTLKDGTYAHTYTTDFGRIDVDELLTLNDYCHTNNLTLRLGTNHHLYICRDTNEKLMLTCKKRPRTVLACAGSEYCPYSYWSIKDETSYLPLEAIERYNIKVGFSGCLKGCAKHQHSDIGIVGLRTNLFGAPQKSARIFLGVNAPHSVAREIFTTIPLPHLKPILTLIVDEFTKSGYESFEIFSAEVLNRLSPPFLELYFLAKYYLNLSCTLSPLDENELIERYFKNTPIYERVKENYKSCSSYLSKELFTIV